MMNVKSGKTIKERLEYYSVPEPNSGCWLWTGTSRGPDSNHKYGSIGVNGRHKYAHRVSYFEFIGPFDEKLDVLHKCDTSLCINPQHLRLGTHKENMNDCKEKGRNPKYKKRLFCSNGHNYDENEKKRVWIKNGNIVFDRECGLCKKIRSKKYKTKLKDELRILRIESALG